jgi:hypothetical protein
VQLFAAAVEAGSTPKLPTRKNGSLVDAIDAARRSPVTTKSTRRLPHGPQTSRLCQSGTLISAP